MTKNHQKEDIELGSFFRQLRGHWHYFVIAFVLLAAFAAFYVKYSLPVYRASASVLLQETSKSSSKTIDDILLGDLFGTTESVATETGVLGSRTVMVETINELNLHVNYFSTSSFPTRPLYKDTPFSVAFDSLHSDFFNLPFNMKMISGNKFLLETTCDGKTVQDYSFSKQCRFGETIETPYFNINITREPQNLIDENGSYRFEILSISKNIFSLLSNLKIETLNKDATILVLTYDDNIPQRAVDILNTICNSYIKLDIRDKATVASLTLKFVDEQLQSTSKQLEGIEKEIQDFKEKNKTVDLSAESKSLLDKINEVETQRTRSSIELKTLDNLLEYVSDNKDLTQLAPSSLGLPDPLLIELIENYQTLQAKRKSASYGMKSNAPNLRILDEQIQDTRSAIIENIKSIQKNINVTNSTLSKQIDGLELNIGRIPSTERELLDIQRRAEVNQNIYVYLLQKQAETSIAKATVVSDNKVLDQALLFDEPVAPNVKLILLLVMFSGCVLPVIFLVIKNALKTTVSNRDEVSRLTDIPVIGIVGHLDHSDNLVVNHKPKSAIAESFRSVRTNLQFMGTLNRKKIILITSSVGNEGKSFVSINLANVFALQNYRVVVVGLDLRKPKIFQDFKMNNTIGVSNYLIGQATLDQVIRKTPIENLDLISSGPVPPNPAELIAKPEMKAMFDELEQRYDFIVVDTPPLGIVSDALLLMNYSHINIYLIRENFSRLEYIKTLDEMYADGRLKNISILLNDSAFSKRYGYGYGHHYGYMNGGSGYYDEDHSTKPFFKRIFSKPKAHA